MTVIRPPRRSELTDGEPSQLSSPVIAIGLGSLRPGPRLRLGLRLGELAVAVALSVATLQPGSSGAALATIGIGVAAVAWLVWIAAQDRRRVIAGALFVMAAAGGVAAVPRSSELVFVAVAGLSAAFSFDLVTALLVWSPAFLGYAIAAGARGSFPSGLSTLGAVGLVGIVSGSGRRHLLEHGRQTALLAIAEKRATIAWQDAELIAERNRLGREMHDVLAHTLGAVSIQLTALDSRVASGDPAAMVRRRIADIHHLVGEGLDEARNAVRALRADGLPLDQQIRQLCELHGAAFSIDGRARPLDAQAALTLYRVAQEALTNASRHAPASPVSVHLRFDSATVSLSVKNEHAAPTGPLISAGGGNGLRFLHERVHLVGGRSQAGAVEDGWRVTAEIPI